jgi:hypothetical protein
MLHAGIPASTVAAWHGHDVRMTTAAYNRVCDEGLTAGPIHVKCEVTDGPRMRDIESIDAEVQLVVAFRRQARERGGPLPSRRGRCAAG